MRLVTTRSSMWTSLPCSKVCGIATAKRISLRFRQTPSSVVRVVHCSILTECSGSIPMCSTHAFVWCKSGARKGTTGARLSSGRPPPWVNNSSTSTTVRGQKGGVADAAGCHYLWQPIRILWITFVLSPSALSVADFH